MRAKARKGSTAIYFVISCICAQKQYVDFRSTAGYPISGIRSTLLCVGGRSTGSRTVRFYSAKSLNRCHLHGPTGTCTVGKMVLLTAARGMHEFFRSEIYCPCRSDPQQTELIKSNSQKSPLLARSRGVCRVCEPEGPLCEPLPTPLPLLWGGARPHAASAQRPEGLAPIVHRGARRPPCWWRRLCSLDRPRMRHWRCG